MFKVLLVPAGEPFDSISITTENLERRWEKLKQQLSETQDKVNLNIERKKLYDELHALKEVMSSYEKWIGVTDKIPEESIEISKQLEQCKVCKHLMLAAVGKSYI